jgi:hypothetical protein
MTPSVVQVHQAIIEAATKKTWQVKTIGKNLLEAHVESGKHSASIIIHYSAEKFSITYKDSQMLRHRGNVIHRTYNRWIKGLLYKINQKLMLL